MKTLKDLTIVLGGSLITGLLTTGPYTSLNMLMGALGGMIVLYGIMRISVYW